MEGQRWSETEQGTPQGSGISPLLANVFMHYALDLWVHQWRKCYTRGRVIIVRYCDDIAFSDPLKWEPEKIAGTDLFEFA